MSLEDKSFQPSSPPPTSSSLSAFKDFQTAWSQRFPDCDIPSRAWEEDVRTNLDKHRQKVAQLRDELEKEEFYVAYLKKLLDDATESKETEIGLTREESTTISSESTRSSPLSSANLLNQSNSRAINLSPCSSGSSSSINREERPLRKDVSCNPAVHSKSPDQYVTVIKVSSQGESDRFTPEQPCQARSAVNNHLKNSNFTPSLTRDKDDGQVSGAPRQSSIEKSDKDTTAQNNETGHLPSSYSAHRSDADDDTKVSRRRRPPTPPRKPKINRSKLPGYPFRSPSSDNDDSSTHNIMSSSTTSLSSCDFYGHPSKPLIGTPPEYRNDQSQAVKPSLGSCSAKSTSIITIQPYSPVGSNSWGERGSNESRGMRKPSSFHRPSQPSSSYSEKSASKISGFSERCTATPSCSSTSSLERAAESFSSLEPEISKSSDVNDAYNREDRDNYDIDTTPSKEFLEPHLRDLIDSETQSSPHQKEDAYDLTYDVVADNDAQNTRANDSEDEAVSDEEEDIYDTVAPDEVSVEDFNAERCEDDFSRPPFRPSRGLSDNLTRDENSDHLDPNSFANYVNIDYFLRREETSSKDESDNEAHFLHSMSSDHDLNLISSGQAQKSSSQDLFSCSTYDEVFVPEDEDHKFSASNSHSDNFGSQEPEDGLGNADDEFITEAERCNMYKSILSSIIDSETVYVDCLFTLIQYRKALKSTTESSHPLLSTMDLDAIFYKIQDLYEIHTDFLNGVKKLANSSDSTEMPTLGDLFKVLASRLEAYSAYLKNYSLALETVQRCSSANNQFSEITRAIKLKSLKSQSVTLEELLHKPVARVQKNALILHDLLKYSRKNSHEYRSLRTALKMTQCFLNELNIAATEQMFPVQDKTQRRVVKDSCVIEGSESRRKLRHLFLFNDTLVCAKYKPSTRQKPACDLKWHALLSEISLSDSGGENKIFHAFCASLLVSLETNTGHKEKEISSEIRNLKSKVSSIRDVILKEKSRSNTKMVEKLKKKLNEHERQLALILPQLPFVISLKNGRAYTFYLSSEFDRTQWIESIKVLQQSLGSVNEQVNLSELQAWIDACKIEKGLNTSLWSYLMPCNREEDALHGELHLTLKTLRGFSEPTKIFIAMEVDTYGHFFQRATTRTVCDSEERSLGQDFTLDLDGSSHLRFICYEESNSSKKPILRGKTTLELGSSWLKDKILSKELIFPGCKLSIDLKYISLETSPMRFPAGKVYGAFGVPISQVTKKEKSNVPYLIVGCVKEVERRGMKEVGVYRVSGLSSDIQRLKKGFETNPYEVEHLLKEIDIHAITGLLKMYLRELPEALFTNLFYKKFFDAFSLTNQEERKKRLIELYFLLPPVNMHTINFLIDHLVEVNRHKDENRMTLHNLATVIGPTLIRPGSTSPPTSSGATNTDTFTAGTIDVMAQAGILYFFLKRKTVELPGNA